MSDMATTLTTEPQRSCQWCGRYHPGRCPEVKSLEFFQNGMVKRIEFVDGRVIETPESKP